jgi:hypothetical protein
MGMFRRRQLTTSSPKGTQVQPISIAGFGGVFIFSGIFAKILLSLLIEQLDF